MSGLLKWDGNVLRLGKTQMAEVRKVWPVENSAYEYAIGPDDHVSEPYEDPNDCRQDCERHVRRLLAKVGQPNA